MRSRRRCVRTRRGLGHTCGKLGHGHDDGARGLDHDQGHGVHGRSCNSQLGERIQCVPVDSSDEDGARHLCCVRGCGGDGGGMLRDRACGRGDMGDGIGVRDVMAVQCASMDSGKANKDQCVAAEPGVADCCKEEAPDTMNSEDYELAYAPDTYDENTKDIYWPLMKIYLPVLENVSHESEEVILYVWSIETGEYFVVVLVFARLDACIGC